MSQSAPSWLQSIGCVTTSRADYGIYRPLLATLAAAQRFRVVRFVGGTHLRPELGDTLSEVRREPLGEVEPVDFLGGGDRAVDIAASAGAALTEFGRAFDVRRVDLLFVLGDRFEMLSAATAAAIHRIPLAHLHGGDVTLGSYDDAFRHAITKISGLHFPAIEPHADRLRRMGEEDWRIRVVGALALDDLARFHPLSPDELRPLVGLDLRQPTLILAVHPETLGDEPALAGLAELLTAMTALDMPTIVIGPNVDEGHRGYRQALGAFAAAKASRRFVESLPQAAYWSCLTHAAALVGNSSAGIIEAASLGLPVVNVGIRQAGRERNANVLDSPWRSADIEAALRRATSPEFKAAVIGGNNLYGDGRAAERIVERLHTLPNPMMLLRKGQPRSP